MSEELTATVDRVKAAAAAHGDTYVELPAADVAALLDNPAALATPWGRTLHNLAVSTARTPGKTVSLHRTVHLSPILAALGA